MKQEAEQLLYACVQAMQLAKTVYDGAQHLDSHPEQTNLRDDMKEAVFAVGETFGQCGQGKTLEAPAQKLCAALENASLAVRCFPEAEKWYICGMETAHTLIVQTVRGNKTLHSPLASALFEFADHTPYTDKARAILLYHVAEACGRTAPRISYTRMMEAFRLHPHLIAIEGREAMIANPTKQHTFSCCPVCGGTGTAYCNTCGFTMQTYDPMFEPAKLWMQCNSCHNLYTYKFPESILRSGKTQKKMIPQCSDDVIKPGWPIRLSTWCDVLYALKAYTKEKDVLEVGVGQGEFIAVALEMGYQIECVEIVEQDAQRIADMLGADIWCCDFLEYQTEKQYAIITMGDVIEHMERPKDALQKAHALLKDDGVLWLSTPNYQSSFSRLRKFSDAMWSESWHISYFYADGFDALARECGFEVRSYRVSNRYNGSMELILTKQGRGTR